MPEHPPLPGRFCRWPIHLAGLAAAVALVGCDIPTELPQVDTRWIVPAEETRFGVAQLLPADVTPTADSTAFLVSFSALTFSESLGTLCAACVAADGLTVPKPPILHSFTSTVDFPPEVSSVSVLSGDVAMEIDNGTSFNGLSFDPLRPAPGVFGEITIVLTDDADGDVLGTAVIDGAVAALPPGGKLTRTMALAPTSVEGSIVATVTVDSPLGDPVTIDTSELLRATATPTDILVSSVTVDVAGRAVTLNSRYFDVGEVGQDLENRVLAGGLVLGVANPFGVAADFLLTLSAPTMTPIQKSASVGPAATSQLLIDFTVEELRSFLGEPDVLLSTTAVVDAGAPAIAVAPGQELVLTGKLDVTLRIGG